MKKPFRFSIERIPNRLNSQNPNSNPKKFNPNWISMQETVPLPIQSQFLAQWLPIPNFEAKT